MLPLHLATLHTGADFFKFVLSETDKQLRYKVMQGTADPAVGKRTRAADLVGERGRTPLMFALEVQAWDTFHYLLEMESDLAVVEEVGNHNALQLALLLGELDAALAILNLAKIPEAVFTNRASRGGTALDLATQAALKGGANGPGTAEVLRLIKKWHPQGSAEHPEAPHDQEAQ